MEELLKIYNDDINDLFLDAINNLNFNFVNSLVEYKLSLLVDVGPIALEYCSRNENKIKMLQLLIDLGVNVNSDNGRAFLIAVKRGCYKSVQLLLEAGTDVHAMNNKAFYYAIEYRDIQILQLLVKHHEESDEKENLKKICRHLKPSKYMIRTDI